MCINYSYCYWDSGSDGSEDDDRPNEDTKQTLAMTTQLSQHKIRKRDCIDSYKDSIMSNLLHGMAFIVEATSIGDNSETDMNRYEPARCIATETKIHRQLQ
ncbi:hypothetical protein BLOT_015915 [Blomia tropicalis]|nr:hypothetical protein BLOT_015915 [Blomia tropicalis]